MAHRCRWNNHDGPSMVSGRAPVADLSTAPGPFVPEGWAAGAWTIDPAHTTVSFVVRHLMSPNDTR
jgi:polyisoprenoid-binding protein YceI